MKTFLILGQTGVGKSSFINSTLGAKMAKVDRYKACTKLVELHSHHTSFGHLRIIDTPGLSEKDDATDIEYLTMVQQFLSKNSVDYFLYVTPLNETRFRSSEQTAIINISKILGHDVWLKSWLIFTFAGKVPDLTKNEAIHERTSQLNAFIFDIVKSSDRNFKKFNKILITDNIDYSWGENWGSNLQPASKLLLDSN